MRKGSRMTEESRNKLSKAKTGVALPHTEEWNKKIGKAVKGPNNGRWKEAKDMTYSGIHGWVNRNCKKEKVCIRCGSEKNLVHALKRGKEYSKICTDYITLCKQCHTPYDDVPERLSRMNRSYDEEELFLFYHRGLNDREIADVTSLSRGVIEHWRRRNNLPSNYSWKDRQRDDEGHFK